MQRKADGRPCAPSRPVLLRLARVPRRAFSAGQSDGAGSKPEPGAKEDPGIDLKELAREAST